MPLVRLLHLYGVGDLSQHTGELRGVLVLDRPADLAEAERPQRAAVPLRLADLAPDLRDAQLAHCASLGPGSGSVPPPCSVALSWAGGCASGSTAITTASLSCCSADAPFSTASGRRYGRTSEICLPRIRATSSGRRSRVSASTVAFAMLIGFVVPSDFARTLRMPASSSTARTPPPAITPVPSEAGRSRTRAAPNRPRESCVIVVPCFGTLKRFFFASSTALVIASGTSRAFP